MIGTVNLTLHHFLSDLMAVALDQTYIHSFSKAHLIAFSFKHHCVWSGNCFVMAPIFTHILGHVFRLIFSGMAFLTHTEAFFCVLLLLLLWVCYGFIYWFHSSNSFYGLLKSKYLNTSWPLLVLISIYWILWADFFFTHRME